MEETMELFNYYSLDECLNRKQVINMLKSYKSDGKIEYSLDQEILKIKDLDLEEDEDDFYGGYEDYDDEDFDDGEDEY